MEEIDMVKNLKKLYKIIEKIEAICKSGASWDVIFDLVFHLRSTELLPTIENLNLHFPNYYDPDTSYEEDTKAFVDALIEFKKDIKKICQSLNIIKKDYNQNE